jgi:uncharacterized protein (TIGR02270 family)
MAIIESIVSQHAEESAFLWLLRDSAIGEPHYSLQDLSDLDNRVEAHLDGLRIAGEEGWPFLLEGLAQQESGEIFAAAVIALEGDEQSQIEQVYAAVEAAPETLRGLISAVGWVSRDRLQGKIAGLLASASPMWRRAGIAACAVHRIDCGRYLESAIDDEDSALRARSLRAVGELGRTDLGAVVQRLIGCDDFACAFWAAWSSTLAGNRYAGVAGLKAIALSDSPFAATALCACVRVLEPAESQRWLKGLAGQGNRLRDLIKACGAVGDPVYVPWLIKQMETAPELSRVSGESFSFITGADIAYEDLEGEPPDGFESGPTEDPGDDDVSMDADEDLPWPDPERILAWWDANKNRFQTGSRYLVGQPISETTCWQVLQVGFQRQRRSAALELALMNNSGALFETRAPGFRQKEALCDLDLKKSA